jgi:hypothetical protein
VVVVVSDNIREVNDKTIPDDRSSESLFPRWLRRWTIDNIRCLMLMTIDNDNDDKWFDSQTLASITSKIFPITRSLFQLRFPNVKVQRWYTLCWLQK